MQQLETEEFYVTIIMEIIKRKLRMPQLSNIDVYIGIVFCNSFTESNCHVLNKIISRVKHKDYFSYRCMCKIVFFLKTSYVGHF